MLIELIFPRCSGKVEAIWEIAFSRFWGFLRRVRSSFLTENRSLSTMRPALSDSLRGMESYSARPMALVSSSSLRERRCEYLSEGGEDVLSGREKPMTSARVGSEEREGELREECKGGVSWEEESEERCRFSRGGKEM